MRSSAPSCSTTRSTFSSAIGCQSVKIASADLNHYPLLRKVARTGLNIQLDTGNGSLGEMEAAVDIIRREGNENIIIHHCPSGYPARLQSINLRVITTLRQMFPYPIAYSDHTPGWDMDIAAVTLGASLVEKTITLDRTTRSVEHIMSLEPPQMREFIKAIRDLEIALGSPRRVMHADEIKKRQANRRSMYLKAAAKAGTRLAMLRSTSAGRASVSARRCSTRSPARRSSPTCRPATCWRCRILRLSDGMPTVLFRCDGGPDIGIGHVMRCRALAARFREQGWTSAFAMYACIRRLFDEVDADRRCRRHRRRACGDDKPR